MFSLIISDCCHLWSTRLLTLYTHSYVSTTSGNTTGIHYFIVISVLSSDSSARLSDSRLDLFKEILRLGDVKGSYGTKSGVNIGCSDTCFLVSSVTTNRFAESGVYESALSWYKTVSDQRFCLFRRIRYRKRCETWRQNGCLHFEGRN